MTLDTGSCILHCCLDAKAVPPLHLGIFRRAGKKGIPQRAMLHVILLSGGSGKRLWPLSNDVFSKQFIRLFRRENGAFESMMMRAYRGIRAAGVTEITVATEKDQVSVIRSQLDEDPDFCTEPCRRDTFPAIALASARIRSRGGSEDDVVVTCPVDAYVEEDYYSALLAAGEIARDPSVRLTLIGIEPTGPDSKYGYILPENSDTVSPVSAFCEKPDTETAAEFIRRGALWNSGIFAFRLGYILDKAQELLGTADYGQMKARYESFPRISFDYAVTEKEKNIRVMRFHGVWKDIGTWNSLAEVLDSPVIGPAIIGDTCKNVTVVNPLNLPLICMDIKDAVVCAAPDGILISGKEASAGLKDYVDTLEGSPRYAERTWGAYEVLTAERNSLTRRIVMQAGNRIQYHAHSRRSECWIVTAGEGTAFIEDSRRPVHPGSIVTAAPGIKHGLLAHEEMAVIEVQMGDYFGTDDRQIFPEVDASV